jgi:hypothetical protein
VCQEEGVERLPGAHCYEVYAGRASFAALHDEEPGTFYHLVARARAAAQRLRLAFELRESGLGELADAVHEFARAPGAHERPVAPMGAPIRAPRNPIPADRHSSARVAPERVRRRRSVGDVRPAHASPGAVT